MTSPPASKSRAAAATAGSKRKVAANDRHASRAAPPTRASGGSSSGSGIDTNVTKRQQQQSRTYAGSKRTPPLLPDERSTVVPTGSGSFSAAKRARPSSVLPDSRSSSSSVSSKGGDNSGSRYSKYNTDAASTTSMMMKNPGAAMSMSKPQSTLPRFIIPESLRRKPSPETLALLESTMERRLNAAKKDGPKKVAGRKRGAAETGDDGDFLAALRKSTSAEGRGGGGAAASQLLLEALSYLQDHRSRGFILQTNDDIRLHVQLCLHCSEAPQDFRRLAVTEALVFLLSRGANDGSANDISSTILPIMSANLLLRAYRCRKQWPASFVRVLLDDCLHERLWCDLPKCHLFRDNVLTVMAAYRGPEGARREGVAGVSPASAGAPAVGAAAVAVTAPMPRQDSAVWIESSQSESSQSQSQSLSQVQATHQLSIPLENVSEEESEEGSEEESSEEEIGEMNTAEVENLFRGGRKSPPAGLVVETTMHDSGGEIEEETLKEKVCPRYMPGNLFTRQAIKQATAALERASGRAHSPEQGWPLSKTLNACAALPAARLIAAKILRRWVEAANADSATSSATSAANSAPPGLGEESSTSSSSSSKQYERALVRCGRELLQGLVRQALDRHDGDQTKAAAKADEDVLSELLPMLSRLSVLPVTVRRELEPWHSRAVAAMLENAPMSSLLAPNTVERCLHLALYNSANAGNAAMRALQTVATSALKSRAASECRNRIANLLCKVLAEGAQGAPLSRLMDALQRLAEAPGLDHARLCSTLLKRSPNETEFEAGTDLHKKWCQGQALPPPGHHQQHQQQVNMHREWHVRTTVEAVTLLLVSSVPKSLMEDRRCGRLTPANEALSELVKNISRVQGQAVTWLTARAGMVKVKDWPRTLVVTLRVALFLRPSAILKAISETQKNALQLLQAHTYVAPGCLDTLVAMGLHPKSPLQPGDALKLIKETVQRVAELVAHGRSPPLVGGGQTAVGEQPDALGLGSGRESAALPGQILKLACYTPGQLHRDSVVPAGGYSPPKFAHSQLYWTAWEALLELACSAPTSSAAFSCWSMPTSRLMMEMVLAGVYEQVMGEDHGGDLSVTRARDIGLQKRARDEILVLEAAEAASRSLPAPTPSTSRLVSELLYFEPDSLARTLPRPLCHEVQNRCSRAPLSRPLLRCRDPDYLGLMVAAPGRAARLTSHIPTLASQGGLGALPLDTLCELLLAAERGLLLSKAGGADGSRHDADKANQNLSKLLRQLVRAASNSTSDRLAIVKAMAAKFGAQDAILRHTAARYLCDILARTNAIAAAAAAAASFSSSDKTGSIDSAMATETHSDNAKYDALSNALAQCIISELASDSQEDSTVRDSLLQALQFETDARLLAPYLFALSTYAKHGTASVVMMDVAVAVSKFLSVRYDVARASLLYPQICTGVASLLSCTGRSILGKSASITEEDAVCFCHALFVVAIATSQDSGAKELLWIVNEYLKENQQRCQSLMKCAPWRGLLPTRPGNKLLSRCAIQAGVDDILIMVFDPSANTNLISITLKNFDNNKPSRGRPMDSRPRQVLSATALRLAREFGAAWAAATMARLRVILRCVAEPKARALLTIICGALDEGASARRPRGFAAPTIAEEVQGQGSGDTTTAPGARRMQLDASGEMARAMRIGAASAAATKEATAAAISDGAGDPGRHVGGHRVPSSSSFTDGAATAPFTWEVAIEAAKNRNHATLWSAVTGICKQSLLNQITTGHLITSDDQALLLKDMPRRLGIMLSELEAVHDATAAVAGDAVGGGNGGGTTEEAARVKRILSDEYACHASRGALLDALLALDPGIVFDRVAFDMFRPDEHALGRDAVYIGGAPLWGSNGPLSCSRPLLSSALHALQPVHLWHLFTAQALQAHAIVDSSSRSSSSNAVCASRVLLDLATSAVAVGAALTLFIDIPGTRRAGDSHSCSYIRSRSSDGGDSKVSTIELLAHLVMQEEAREKSCNVEVREELTWTLSRVPLLLQILRALPNKGRAMSELAAALMGRSSCTLSALASSDRDRDRDRGANAAAINLAIGVYQAAPQFVFSFSASRALNAFLSPAMLLAAPRGVSALDMRLHRLVATLLETEGSTVVSAAGGGGSLRSLNPADRAIVAYKTLYALAATHPGRVLRHMPTLSVMLLGRATVTREQFFARRHDMNFEHALGIGDLLLTRAVRGYWGRSGLQAVGVSAAASAASTQWAASTSLIAPLIELLSTCEIVDEMVFPLVYKVFGHLASLLSLRPTATRRLLAPHTSVIIIAATAFKSSAESRPDRAILKRVVDAVIDGLGLSGSLSKIGDGIGVGADSYAVTGEVTAAVLPRPRLDPHLEIKEHFLRQSNPAANLRSQLRSHNGSKVKEALNRLSKIPSAHTVYALRHELARILVSHDDKCRQLARELALRVTQIMPECADAFVPVLVDVLGQGSEANATVVEFSLEFAPELAVACPKHTRKLLRAILAVNSRVYRVRQALEKLVAQAAVAR